ncbi:MAG: hypothetical protein HWN65_18695 [Candidatus Helarchaeota archaeon]|nr:hypothetical protein [Candidatus Helarchaeota archaeon]
METENVYWQEIYEEEKLDLETELDSEGEEISKESSTGTHEKLALKHKIPGFDFTSIEKILAKMDTFKEKIKWLRNFKTQLQQSQKAMAMNSWTVANSKSIENQYKSMTPYIQTVSIAIRAIQNRIRLLKEAQKRSMRSNLKK